MKDKEKQIEEMEEIIVNSCKRNNEVSCQQSKSCESCYAKDLYNAGYRKIPEGSVVFTQEEYLRMVVEERALDKASEDQARKQAVKEVLENIKEEISQAIKSNYKAIEDVPDFTELYQWCKGKITALRGIDDYIDEIAKEMGVEL